MKKALIIAGICIVVTLLVLGLIGLFSSLGAYREMNAAKNLLFTAVEKLENGELEEAGAKFSEARVCVERADSKLNSNVVGTGFLKMVPYAGTQVRALNSFISIADHLCNAGTFATEALREVPGLDSASPQGQATIATMVDLLPRLADDLAPVEEELLLAHKESSSMKTGWLIGRASTMKAELDEKLDRALGTIKKARMIMSVVPDIMGAEGAPPKRYMVLQQDCYELRASGGLMSTYGILECTHGSIELTEYKRSNKLIGLAAGDETPPLPSLGGWMVSYGIAPTLCFYDAGWWPDFPLTTEIISTIWSKNRKAPVDGFIAVDPIAIGYILEEIGPVKVPDFNETVTAENLSSLILHYKEIRKGNEFLESLSSRFFQDLVISNPNDWIPLGRAIGKALDEKHMLLYFYDPIVEQCFSELDWSGEVKETEDDYVMAVDCNVGGNEVYAYKANFFINQSMSLEVTRQEDSTLRHHVTYTLDNTSGATEFPLTYKSYLRLYVPEGAIIDGAVDLTASGLVDSYDELGKHVFGKLVDVPVGQTKNVEFDYVTPGYESLLIEKQSGVPNMNVNYVYIEDGSIKRIEDVVLQNEVYLDLSE